MKQFVEPIIRVAQVKEEAIVCKRAACMCFVNMNSLKKSSGIPCPYQEFFPGKIKMSHSPDFF